MAWARTATRIVTALALTAFAACSATESQQRNPTAPSAATASATSQAADEAAPDRLPRRMSAMPGTMGSGVPLPPPGAFGSDVTFPPRNEPLLFRQALEVKYRDELRRQTVETFGRLTASACSRCAGAPRTWCFRRAMNRMTS